LPNDSPLTPEDFYDTTLYRKRHIIERLFERLKENKRIALRFDKLDATSLALSLLLFLRSINYFVDSAIAKPIKILSIVGRIINIKKM